MPITPQQFLALYPVMLTWIQRTLSAHPAQARSVASLRFPRLPHYYSETTLNAGKFVVVPRVPVPPLSSLGLHQFAAFEQGDYDGITYLDTYFVKRGREADEVLHFHELIHVMQWRLLGPQHFLAAYADGLERYGYRNSPLEAMAYNAADVFTKSSQLFDAEKHVHEKLHALQLL